MDVIYWESSQRGGRESAEEIKKEDQKESGDTEHPTPGNHRRNAAPVAVLDFLDGQASENPKEYRDDRQGEQCKNHELVRGEKGVHRAFSICTSKIQIPKHKTHPRDSNDIASKIEPEVFDPMPFFEFKNGKKGIEKKENKEKAVDDDPGDHISISSRENSRIFEIFCTILHDGFVLSFSILIIV